MDIISINDLPAALQSAEMISTLVAGANARAVRVAPCLASTDPEPSEDLVAEARLVLIGAVQRWAEAGSGAFQSQQAGPFGITVDTRQRTGFNLWPSEIKDLQDLCRAAATSTGAFSITPSGSGSGHIPWCAKAFGALYCSCGYELTGTTPIYELGDECVDYY